MWFNGLYSVARTYLLQVAQLIFYRNCFYQVGKLLLIPESYSREGPITQCNRAKQPSYPSYIIQPFDLCILHCGYFQRVEYMLQQNALHPRSLVTVWRRSTMSKSLRPFCEIIPLAPIVQLFIHKHKAVLRLSEAGGLFLSTRLF